MSIIERTIFMINPRMRAVLISKLDKVNENKIA